ncbi:hypothetical protein [Haloarchaeobius amylolyticus]|uniref:hypothetical protein n=1 Tax=Haloarchaeobius amylolyticus TaxID=1198296 RepID=UPI00226EEAE0|nr:hypothetical protein [Haloarchaeobius amylolyticus]
MPRWSLPVNPESGGLSTASKVLVGLVALAGIVVLLGVLLGASDSPRSNSGRPSLTPR